jgi:hypothetical protein
MDLMHHPCKGVEPIGTHIARGWQADGMDARRISMERLQRSRLPPSGKELFVLNMCGLDVGHHYDIIMTSL